MVDDPRLDERVRGLPPELRIEIANYARELRSQVQRLLPELEESYEFMFDQIIHGREISTNEIRLLDNELQRFKRTMLYKSDPYFRTMVKELERLGDYAAGIVWGNGVENFVNFINVMKDKLYENVNLSLDPAPDFWGVELKTQGLPVMRPEQVNGLNLLVDRFVDVTRLVKGMMRRNSELMRDRVNRLLLILYLYKYVLLIAFTRSVKFDTADELAEEAVSVLGNEFIMNMDLSEAMRLVMDFRGQQDLVNLLDDFRADMEEMFISMKSTAIGGYEW